MVAWLYTCVSDDREAARRAVSRMVMASVITSRTILDQLGIVLPDELADRVASGRWTYAEDEMLAAARLLPEEVIEAFAVYGTAKECDAGYGRSAPAGLGSSPSWSYPARA